MFLILIVGQFLLRTHYCLLVGKVDDESRKVIMADTVYCFPYVEK